MNHSTINDECRDHRSIQAKTIRKLQQLSQDYMNAATRYNHPASVHMCILFSDRAIEYLLKALYVERNSSMAPPASFSLSDVILLPALDSGLDLNMMTLIYNIHFLAGCNDLSLLQQMDTPQLTKLLNCVNDIHLQLSARIAT